MTLKTISLAATIFSSLIASAAYAQGQLNMICGSPQPVCDAVMAEFSKQSGIDVSFIRMSAGEAYAKLRAEARNPKTDVWFSGTQEAYYQAAYENLTESYKSPSFDNLIPLGQKMALETDYKATSFAVGVIGFVWNTQTLQEKNLPEPTSWADLLKPEYKGEIALSNPNTAGTGYSFLVALVELMGEDAAFDYMKKLNNNITNYTKSGAAVGTQVARGEASLAVIFLHDAHIMLRQGFPLKTAAPVEGTGYSLDSVSLVRGARNPQAAKAFIDWILTPEAQSINIENGLNSHPTAKGTIFSPFTVNIEGMKLLDIDQRIYGAPEKRRALLSRWDREIGSIAGNSAD